MQIFISLYVRESTKKLPQDVYEDLEFHAVCILLFIVGAFVFSLCARYIIIITTTSTTTTTTKALIKLTMPNRSTLHGLVFIRRYYFINMRKVQTCQT